jgi:hypothetical protein
MSRVSLVPASQNIVSFELFVRECAPRRRSEGKMGTHRYFMPGASLKDAPGASQEFSYPRSCTQEPLARIHLSVGAIVIYSSAGEFLLSHTVVLFF